MAEASWLDANPERLKRRDECRPIIAAAYEANAAMDKTDLPCEGRIQGKVQSRAAHAIRSSANGALEWGQW
jgi:hypothetical protein